MLNSFPFSGHSLPDVHGVDRRGESGGVQRLPRQPAAVQARPGLQLGSGVGARVVDGDAVVRHHPTLALRQQSTDVTDGREITSLTVIVVSKYIHTLFSPVINATC